MSHPWKFRAALLVWLVLGAGALVSLGEPYSESMSRKGFFWFLRAAKPTPAEQVAYAEQLAREGRLRAASRQYLACTIYYADAPQAPAAQMRLAELFEQRTYYLRAFDEYQRLFDVYPGRFSYDGALDRQFRLAVFLMERRKGRFLFLPGFPAPERAVPLFEKIVQNAPAWAHAPEAQYRIGRAHELTGQFELGVAAYMIVENRYPDSPFAEKAGYGACICLYEIAEENPSNEQAMNEALASMALYEQRYPSAEKAEAIRAMRRTLNRQRARVMYDIARYYDRSARKPAAALMQYESFVKLFPDSEWVGPARLRIGELKREGVNAHVP